MRIQVIAAFALFFVVAHSEAKSPADLWITATSKSNRATGTQRDPLDGSTQEKFDAIMAAAEPGTRLHLGPGVYVTRGVHLKEGWWLKGAGREQTTIKLADDVLGGDGATTATVLSNFDFQHFLHRIRISDLTVDCNRTAQSGITKGRLGALNALVVAVRRSRIERVRAVGTWANPGEGFPFSVMSTERGGETSRAEIEACENLGPIGNLTAISAFDQTGGRLSGFIRHCRVENGPDCAAYGSGGWRDFRVSDNTARNVGAGVVIDTHNYENVIIDRNRFLKTQRYGIVFNGSGRYEKIVVRANYVEMDTGAEWSLVTSEAKVRATIEGNTFIQRGSVRPALWIGTRTTGTFRNNRIREAARSDLRSGHGLSFGGNQRLLRR